jgi:hypothetical protein
MAKTIGFLHYDNNPQVGAFGFLKKIGLAIPRNAFLLLVKLNGFKMAERVYKAIKKNPKGLEKKWKSLGGSYKALVNATMKRINTRIKKGKQVAGMDPEMIGTVAAIMASALPIIKALAQFIGKGANGAAGGDEEST